MAENSETCMVANVGTVEVNGAPLMPVVRCRLSLYGEKPDTKLVCSGWQTYSWFCFQRALKKTTSCGWFQEGKTLRTLLLVCWWHHFIFQRSLLVFSAERSEKCREYWYTVSSFVLLGFFFSPFFLLFPWHQVCLFRELSRCWSLVLKSNVSDCVTFTETEKAYLFLLCFCYFWLQKPLSFPEPTSPLSHLLPWSRFSFAIFPPTVP